MTIAEALLKLIESKEFKEAARTNATYRVKLGRIRNGELKENAGIDLLKKFGYTIEAKEPKNKK